MDSPVSRPSARCWCLFFLSRQLPRGRFSPFSITDLTDTDAHTQGHPRRERSTLSRGLISYFPGIYKYANRPVYNGRAATAFHAVALGRVIPIMQNPRRRRRRRRSCRCLRV